MDLGRRTRRRALKAAPMGSAIFSRNYVTSKTLFRLNLVTLMIALTGVFASLARAADSPAAQMQGGCGDYKWDMSAEFAAWAATPMQVESGRNDDEAPAVELGKRYDVTLRSHESVQFANAPEKDRGGPGKSSGLLKFSPPDDGLYRISASVPLWIDVVQAGARRPSEEFEAHGGCETIHKSVAFRLKAGQSHIIQLNGSPLKTAGLLITKVKE